MDRLMSSINDYTIEIYVDYIDTFIVDTSKDNHHEFELSYKPILQSMMMLINGIAYINNDTTTFYTYSDSAKTVRWVFDSSVGGFDLEDGFNIAFIYNINIADNNLKSIDDIN
jgi:hypothetical protein